MRVRSLIVSAGAVCLLSIANIFAAEDWATSAGSCYAKGDKEISAAVSFFYLGAYGAFDYGFHDAISGGAAIGFNGYSLYGWSYNTVPVLVRAGFHPFNLTYLQDKIKIRDKLDVYIGPSVGWSFGWTSWSGSGIQGSAVGWGGLIFREYLGARYYFMPNLSVFAEDCGGMGVINIGLTLKF